MNEQLKVIISAEIDKLKKGMQDARDEMSDFQRHYENASKNVDENFQSIGQASVNAMKTVGIAIAGAATAILALGASTTEYRENMAKLNTAFESAGGSAKVAKDTYNDLYRVMGESDTATEAAGHLAKLTTEEKALSEWTNICQGVYATFGDSIPIESLAEGASEASRTGTMTAGLTDALVWAGVAEDEFNEKLQACTTQQEREALIRNTLNGIYDEAASKYEKNNAKVLAQREAQAKLSETTAKLGEAVQPVLTAFTSFANDALAVVTPYIQSLAENYMPVLQSALEGTADAIGTAMGFIADHWEILLGIAGVIAGITAAIGLYNIVAAVKAAMDAAQVTTLWGLVTAYAAQAAAMVVAIAPYLLIVAAIAAVIAIIVLCVKHWDKIKEVAAKTWKKMKEATKEAVDAVVKKFGEFKDKAAEKVQAMKDVVVNKFNEVKSGISTKIANAKEAVSTGFQNMKSAATDKVSSMVSSVKNKFNAIKDGIKEKINAAKDAVKTAIDKIKGFFDFKWSLPKLKMPSISIKGKFSLNPPSVPKFSINWNALGGVFDKPTVLPYGNTLQGLGEQGAEAIVPLEKNTQWLDRIADKLAAKQNGIPIVLQVDGKTFAETSISTINALTRAKGTLGLNLV